MSPQPVTAAVAAAPPIGMRVRRALNAPAYPRPLQATQPDPGPPLRKVISRACRDGECGRCPGKVTNPVPDGKRKFLPCSCTRRSCAHRGSTGR